MQQYYLIPILVLFVFLFSCSEKNPKQEVTHSETSQITEMIPDWKQGQEIISIKRVIPIDLNDIDLELSIIAREESIQNGNFDLEIYWMFKTNTRTIQIPVVPKKLYTRPSIKEIEEKKYHIGYLDQEELFHALYEIDFIENNLRFKQIKSFHLN